MVFWSVAIVLFFISLGKSYSLHGILYDTLNFVVCIDKCFVGVYLMLYLLSPFINACINNVDRQGHTMLIIILLAYYSILGTIWNCYTFNYLGWAVTMYIVGAYLRLHPLPKPRISWGTITAMLITCLWASVLVIDLKRPQSWARFLHNPSLLPIFAIAVAMFMAFINLDIKSNRLINTIASTTFAIYIIHDNSANMRHWLYIELLDNVGHFNNQYFGYI